MATDGQTPPEGDGEGTALPAGATDRSEGVNYPLPQSLTRQGRNAFNRRLELMITELVGEINLQTSVTSAATAREAETTAADVDRGYNSWLNRKLLDDQRAAHAQRQAEQLAEQIRVDTTKRHQRVLANWSLLVSLMVTLATLGIGLITNYLNAPWQWMAFGGMLTMGVLGSIVSVVLMWHRRDE